MFLVKIFNFELTLQLLTTFLLGVLLGFLLLLLIYLYAVLRGLNKELKLNNVQEEDIDEEEIKWMIEDAQNQFKNKEVRYEVGYTKLLTRVVTELTEDIAKKFYPESPYPYLELTIDETLELTSYIRDRIDQLISNPIMRMFRGMTIRKIVELNQTKSKIEESRIVKTAKKTGVSKIAKQALKIINVANPFYWFKKATIDQVIKVIMVRIGLAVIGITGEETYKIYSKKVFNKEKTIETNVDDLYESFKEGIKEEDFVWMKRKK